MVRKFEGRAPLDDGDRAALLSLPFEERHVGQHRYIAREGDRPRGATLLIEGLAIRHKITTGGARQILSMHVPGDFVDLENMLLKVADHNVQALTDCQVAVVPGAAISSLIDARPKIAHALWVDTLIDASIFREWIVNVGRRDAFSAACHLMCEFACRLDPGCVTGGYELPMTQEQLADALGVTPVHVNRVLRDLEDQHLIARRKRFIHIPDWARLRKAAGFNELYLHLDQSAPAAFPGLGDHASIARQADEALV